MFWLRPVLGRSLGARVFSLPVIWFQTLSCFLLWVAYAVWQTRRAGTIRVWAFGIPRLKRGLLAAGLFVVPAAALLGLLLGMASARATTPAGLVAWAWATVAVAGLGYVHTQTLATALLVSLAHEAVTRDRAEPSEPLNHLGNTSDEAPSP